MGIVVGMALGTASCQKETPSKPPAGYCYDWQGEARSGLTGSLCFPDASSCDVAANRDAPKCYPATEIWCFGFPTKEDPTCAESRLECEKALEDWSDTGKCSKHDTWPGRS